ncbi:glycosyltransferase family 2 protein [Cytobacillus purgationiresistens]|uniref:Glycosyltransferase involved in cell wall biosynthesis n=1 Tax=Cytobacillus purgationiresistens TaxID=863449 RepID=A0ABU0AI35_9BACI|nr:glycosyltransferase family 2 protein [Cytobacillus purgationiresistens]MDQ0270926.1 glycosyltransferase involved in cell wall biosynthesis [Cytobacillus purgationiresistens]
MKTLTIFTPAYNRAYCLGKCYESLLRQTNQEFIWLIIDDGSTDETGKLVDSWVKEQKIEIQYYYQENQGMHGAHNKAYQLIETDLNMCIDSDDYLADGAVEKIIHFWQKNGNKDVSGIIGLDADQHQRVIGTRMPAQIKRSTLFNLYNKYGVTGDKKLVYRTELTNKYPYPIFQDEKYVGLAFKYYKLDQEYEMLLLDEVLCHVEYLEDGSTHNMINQYRKNPKGFAFYRKELMKLPYAGQLFKFRQAIHFVSSSLMMRNQYFLKESPKKGLTLLAIPFGLLLYVYILFKSRTVKHV